MNEFDKKTILHFWPDALLWKNFHIDLNAYNVLYFQPNSEVQHYMLIDPAR